MNQVTCAQCGAAFDVTPDLPPAFACGSCGGEVTRPARAPAARAPSARARVAQHHHYREELEAAAPKDKKLIYVVIAVAVLCVGGGLFFFFTAGSKSKGTGAVPPATPPVVDANIGGTAAAVDAKPKEEDSKPKEPVAATEDATKELPSTPERPPEPVETGSPELARTKRAMKQAKTAQEHFDSVKLGQGQRDAVRKATPTSMEIPEFDRLIAVALESAIKVDPDFAPAHAELGHVKYSKSETTQWASGDRTPKKLKAALEATMAAIGGDRDVIWLAGDLVAKHGGVLAEGRLLYEDRGTTKTSWFYDRARKSSLRIEGEIGLYFSGDKNKDGFDPVIFRPYLVMVQKDPQRPSVDRAYEVVLLVRTLEDTWRRRYAKEIDFSGSMSAPPIVLLGSREDYKKYMTRNEVKVKPVLSAGHYEPSDRRMFIYHSSEEEERNVIFHEGTHMLFDHKNSAKEPEIQAKQSMWFSEGIAEYFGGHGATGEKDPVSGSVIYEPGRVNDTRIAAIEMARRFKQLIKFEDLIAVTRMEWGRRNDKEMMWSQMIYAQGWALVYYLNHADSGKYQKDFVEYMKLELVGKSGMETFKEVFGKHDMAKLEKGYNDFIDYVIKKHKDKKIVGGRFVD